MPVFVERRHSLFLNGKRDGFNRNSYVRRYVLLGVCSPPQLCLFILAAPKSAKLPPTTCLYVSTSTTLGLGPSPACGGLVLPQGALGHSPWAQPTVGPPQGCGTAACSTSNMAPMPPARPPPRFPLWCWLQGSGMGVVGHHLHQPHKAKQLPKETQ